jgi:outer membrane protein OmpA-like peptidoglycan-associated protein
LKDDSGISLQWYQGKLECSFHTTVFLENEASGITLNNIIPQGRKLITDISFCEEDTKFPPKDKLSFLPNRILTGVEIFPNNNAEYPLDRPRKFNAIEVIITNPIITHVRIVDGIRQGKLFGDIYFRLEKAYDNSVHRFQSISNDSSNIPVRSGSSLLGNFDDLRSNNGCNILGIFKRFYLNKSVLTNDQNSSLEQRGGCLSLSFPPVNVPSNRVGCMPAIGGGAGCFNVFRIGCGGIVLILLLLGFLSIVMRACSETAISNEEKEDIEKTEEKVDIDPWIEDSDNRQDKVDDTGRVQRKFKTIIIPNLQFKEKSAQLLPGTKSNLDKLSLYLLQNLELNALIIGHTDAKGDDQLNLILSQKRAKAVMDYLIFNGVSAERLESMGKGETEPLVQEESAEERLMNRRVEVTFFNRFNSSKW